MSNKFFSCNYRSQSAVLLCLFFTQGALAAEATEVEVLHMWKASSELYALGALKEAVIEDGTIWHDYWVKDNFVGIQNELSRRMSINDAPTAVQWILGENIQNLVETNVFRSIDDGDARLKGFLEPEVYKLVEHEAKLAALPVGIHTQNHIVYNKSLLEEFSLEPATSWQELLSYGPKLKAAGINLIAISDQDWQIRNLAFSIASSLLSAEEFAQFQSEGEDIEHLRDKLHEMVSIMAELSNFANTDYQDMDWEKVSAKVADGSALVQVLGDYIVPEFLDRSNIHCDITPNSNYFLWGVDSFAFPKSNDSSVIEGQNRFITALSDPDVIKNYVLRKGGIPVNVNVLPEELDDCVGNIANTWNEKEIKLWTGGQQWQKRLGIMGVFLSQEWREGIPDSEQTTDKLIKLLHSTF